MKKAQSRERIQSGVVKRHPDGFGFFISDEPDQPDVYIPRPSMQGVMTNDKVKVSIEREKGGERFRGEIVEIVSRAVTRVVGKIQMRGSAHGEIVDGSFGWGEDLAVSIPPGSQAYNGALVVVQIEEYPGSMRGFSGRLITVIGDSADPMNDSIRMLHVHNIPHEFSKRTLAEAKALPHEVTEKDWKGRKDLRDLKIITIDGKTAKDFDDAVYVETENGGFHLYVAIADVSHYVKPGSPIDEDAYLRGTSTYFPNFVSPMLPEALSNELCSLKPRVPRLALVAEMNFDFQGEMTSSKFYEAVILSHARVTYGEAQEVVEGRTPEGFKEVEGNIKRCADLAKVLMNRRMRNGSLDLDLPETVIEVDDTGQPVDIMRSERLFAHRLIEELMLAANVAVATFFIDNKIDAIYRIHDEPNPEAMRNFETFLRAFGYKHKLTGGHLQKRIGDALEFFKDHPKSHVLNTLALRSLAQAKYSPQNVGHFGLGFKNYTHFTSPIRRYPDLIVHRLLKALIAPEKGYALIPLGNLESAGTMLSACEQRSVKAERQIHSIKKARFMSKFVGEEFDGVINSITRFGMFVQLTRFDIDGLLRLEDLGGDRFEFDEEKMRLQGRNSGMSYEIGDPMKVVVAKADIDQGQIDFVMAGQTVSRAQKGAGKGRPSAQSQSKEGKKAHAFQARGNKTSKRGSSEDDSRGPSKSRVSHPRRSR